MRTNFTAYHCLFISRGFKSCFYSKTGKRQHKIETCFCEAQKLRFARKAAKNPEKLIIFQGFCSGQHFYPLNMVWSMRLELTRVNHTPLKRTRLPIPPRPHAIVYWCERRDLNPYCLQHEPESCASANSATLASTYILLYFLSFVKCFLLRY